MLPYICSAEDHRRYIRRQKFGKNFSGILGCAALLLSKLSATGNHFVEQMSDTIRWKRAGVAKFSRLFASRFFFFTLSCQRHLVIFFFVLISRFDFFGLAVQHRAAGDLGRELGCNLN